jgi:hypothetical protein
MRAAALGAGLRSGAQRLGEAEKATCLRHGISTVTSTTVDALLGTVRRPDGCVVVTPNYGDEVPAQLLNRADKLVSLLLARMDGEKLPTADRQIIHQQLVRRGST